MQSNTLRALAATVAIIGGVAILIVRSGERDTPMHSAEGVLLARASEVAAEAPEAQLVDPGVAAGAAEHAPARAAVARAEQSEDTFPCAVFGRFVDTAGMPLAGVHVELELPERELTSDALGRFRFEVRLAHARRGKPLKLVARMAGSARHVLSLTVEGEELDLGDIVLGPAGSVAGRVVDEGGAGFPGAEVLVTPLNPLGSEPRAVRPPDVLASATSEVDGRFSVTGLAGGEVRVWAGAEGLFWAYTDAVLVRAGAETGDLTLRLVPIGDDVIELVVLDPQGRPVPRAPISYRYQTAGHSGSGGATADERGRYRRVLEIAAPFDFSARDPEDRYRPAVVRDVQPGERNVVLQLGEPRNLAVRVRDLAGKLLPEFSVSVQTFEGDHTLSGQERAATEAEVASGVLVIQLPPETFELAVEAAGHQREQIGPYDPELVPVILDVALAPLPGVRGRVVDRAGAPCPGARVSLHESIGGDGTLTVNGFPCRSQRGDDITGFTDDDGRFSLTLRERGRFFLRARKDGYAADEIGPMELSPATGSQGLELVLGVGGAIEGRVIPPPDESPAGLIVGVSRGDGFGLTGATDAEGKFRFDGLMPGKWLVQRRREQIEEDYTTSSRSTSDEPQEIPWSCEVWAGRTTHFDLDLSLSARVVVEGRLALCGEPQVGWTVSLARLEPAQAVLGQEHTNSQGEFRFELSDPGRHRLQFTGMFDGGFFFVLQEIELDFGSNPWELSVPCGRIEGTVLPGMLAEGEGIQLVYSGPKDLMIAFSVRPDAHGAFACPAPAGAVSVGLPSGEKQTVQVVEGATFRVAFP